MGILQKKKKKNTVRTGVAILIANVSAVGSCDDFMDADMQTIRRLKVERCILYI